jgi:hypothetical protein
MKGEKADRKAVLKKEYGDKLKYLIDKKLPISIKELSQNSFVKDFYSDTEKNGWDFIQASALILRDAKEIFVISRDDVWKQSKEERRNISGAAILFSTGFESTQFASIEKIEGKLNILTDNDDNPSPHLPRSIVNYSDPKKDLKHALYGRKIRVVPSKEFDMSYFGFGYRCQPEKERRYFFGIWQIDIESPVEVRSTDPYQNYDRFFYTEIRNLEVRNLGEKLIFDRLILSLIKEQAFEKRDYINFSPVEIAIPPGMYALKYVRSFSFLDLLRECIAHSVRYDGFKYCDKEEAFANVLLSQIAEHEKIEDIRVEREPRAAKSRIDFVIHKGSNKAVVEIKMYNNYMSSRAKRIALEQVVTAFKALDANEAYLLVFDKEGEKGYDPRTYHTLEFEEKDSIKVVCMFINLKRESPTVGRKR